MSFAELRKEYEGEKAANYEAHNSVNVNLEYHVVSKKKPFKTAVNQTNKRTCFLNFYSSRTFAYYAQLFLVVEIRFDEQTPQSQASDFHGRSGIHFMDTLCRFRLERRGK